MNTLSVYTLGRFRALLSGELIPEETWGTQKTKSLFKILITFAGRSLTREQFVEWLWADLAPDAAARNLRVAVSQLRRVLEPELPHGSRSSFILTTDAGYTLNLQADWWCDAPEFQKLCASLEMDGQGEDPAALTARGERARALYLGDYLEEDRYADWATVRREELREEYLGLLTHLAEAYARQGRYQRAVALCREALAADSARESVWRQLMLYHYHAGDQNRAVRAYQECQEALSEEIGVEPLPETTALYEQIREHRLGTKRDAAYPEPANLNEAVNLPFSLSRLPFVGREGEYAWLNRQWRMTQDGHGRFVLLEGEAGLGKTRLAQELIEQVRSSGATILSGKGRESGSAIPFQPIIDALRSEPEMARRAVRSLDPVWRSGVFELIPEWNAGDESGALPGREPGRLFEALTRFFTLLSSGKGRPPGLILFLDDLHWADQSTIDFLGYFGSRLAASPVMVLGSARADELDADSPLARCLAELDRAQALYRLVVQPLTREDLLRLMQQISRDSPSAGQLAPHLFEETQGHPLFVVARLQSLVEEGVCQIDQEGRWHCDREYLDRDPRGLAVPPAVGAVILARVRRLEVRTQRLLALAAVIGRPFDLSLLERASGQGEEALLDALEPALEHRLLRATERSGRSVYDLIHDLVGRTVYASLSPDRRALLHRKVLLALSSTPAQDNLAAELAHHAIKGRAWAKAVEYCKSAAEDALAHFALKEAQRHCESGLAALDALEASAGGIAEEDKSRWRFDLLASKQLAWHLHGRRDKALLDQMMEWARRSGDRERIAETYYALLKHYIDTGQNEAALKLVPEYERIIAEGVKPLTAINFGQRVGFLYYRAGEMKRSLESHDRALELARTGSDTRQEATVLNTRGTVLICLGRYQQAIEDFTRAADIWKEPALRVWRTFALDNRGDVFYYLGKYAEDLAVKEAALPVYREFGYPIAEAECLSETGACLLALGRMEQGETFLHQGLDLSRSLQDGYDTIQSLLGLARLHIERGGQPDLALAAEHASLAIEEGEKSGLPHGVIWGLALQARARLCLGQTAEALALSSRAAEIVDSVENIEGAEEEIYFIYSQVLARNGRVEEAEEALRRAYAQMIAKAERLTDPGLRTSFLERVPVNRSILDSIEH